MCTRLMMSLLFAVFACLGLGCQCDSSPNSRALGKLTTDLPAQRLHFFVSDPAQTIEHSFLLYNEGNAPIVVKSAMITGDTASLFGLVKAPSFPLTLAPGKEHGVTLYIQRKGGPLADQIARIAFAYDSPDSTESLFYVELQSQTPRGHLRFSCGGVLSFGKVRYGQQKTESCIIQNLGDTALTIHSMLLESEEATAREFRLKEVTFPLVLASGQETTLFVTYAPQDLEGLEDRGRFVMESDLVLQPGEPKPSLQVSGTTQAALLEVPDQGTTKNSRCLQVTPGLFDFGAVEASCDSKEQRFQITNAGGPGCRDLKINKVSLQPGSSSAFTIQKSPFGLLSQDAATPYELVLRYQPKEQGREHGVLLIETNDPTSGRVSILLSGTGGGGIEQTDTFRQIKHPLRDVLFVVEHSSSMGDKQANLLANFEAYFNWLVRLRDDYHVMVTTTDVSGKDAPAGCARGQVKIIDRATHNPVQTFVDNTRAGTGGSHYEQGLEAAYQALSPKMLNDPNCNKGFLRNDATLYVIIVSDEDDQSPSPVMWYVSFFKRLKGIRHLELIRLSAIVGPPPSGCHNQERGSASSSPRYWEASRQLKGIQESICNTSWAGTLSHIGSLTFPYPTQFFLSRPANPKTIVVKVNGSFLKEDPQMGWTYNATNHTVNFSKSAVPAPGEMVEIKYQVLCRASQ